MNKNINCSYCGNPDVETKRIDDNLGNKSIITFCSVCNKQSAQEEGLKIISEDEFEHIVNSGIKEIILKYGEDFGGYAKDFDIREACDAWLIFMWEKDENGDFNPNLSKANIEKCQQIYDKDPNDKNNLIRLLLLKIFAGLDYSEIASNFVTFWRNRKIYLDFWFCLIWEWEEIIDPYLPKLRDFVLGLMETDLKRFKDEVSEEEWMFNIYNRVVGISELSRIIDPISLTLSPLDFRWDDEYLKYYALAKFYYSEERWRDAFTIFLKLQIYNEAYNVTNDDLSKISNLEYFKDILINLPTVEDIENNCEICFSKINFENKNEREKLHLLIGKLYFQNWNNQFKCERKEGELGNYLNIYTLFANIFSEIAQSKYDEAFNRWVGWDKNNIKLIGIDIWETTKSLKRLKDNIGNKDSNLSNLFSNNYFVQYFSIISDIEIKLREFIENNLKAYYGEDNEAWMKGVPQKIRIESRTKQEQKSDPKVSCWSFLDLPDYLEIIRKKENWINVFKKHFILEKNDSNKKSDELTSFLPELIHLRNTVVHVHRPLDDSEKVKIENAANLIDKIYKKWKKYY